MMYKIPVCIVSSLILQLALFGAENSRTFDAPRWMPADYPGSVVLPGSALDMSRAKARYPIAENGRLILDGQGRCVFEKHPTRPVRLMGANGEAPDSRILSKLKPEEWKTQIDALADQVRVQGYDYVRTNIYLDSAPFLDTAEPQVPNSEMIKFVDYWIYALRQRNCHLYGTLVSYQFGFPVWKQGMGRRTDFKCRTFYGEPKALAQWDKIVVNMLNHVNPYTGLAWKDDPVFLNLEFYNEQEICLPEVFIAGRISIEGRNFILRGFSSFLQRKYKTDQALSKAWGKKIENFNHGLRAGNPPQGVAELDWAEYTIECGRKTYRHFLQTARMTGYKGLATNFNYHPGMNYSNLRSQCVDFVAMNAYFYHPSKWMNTGSKVGQNSSVEALGGYWRGLVSSRIYDRPFFVTEYNHCYWNPYVYEAGLLFPAYSSLQGFSGLTAHAGQVKPEPRRSPDCFDAGTLPTMRANEILAMMLFGRGDVAVSPRRVDVALSRDFLSKEGGSCMNMQQTLLALVCGFAVRFPEIEARSGQKKADWEMPPAKGASHRSFEWAMTVTDDTKTDVITHAIVELRRRGIISPENKTNPVEKIYQSDTGEITLYGKEKRLQVITPRTEGVTLTANAPARTLGMLTIVRNTMPGTVAVTSLDGQPLSRSRHILLLVNTMSAASGLKLSLDGTTLIDRGHWPILMETGVVHCRLQTTLGNKFKLYPLSINGIRRPEIALKRLPGILEFEINTGKLPNGVTPYFELIAQ